ncbi:hypothetical protein [Thalassospira marina]|uniref:hypothetical protein n=1 Tax=Thalassospira marina TaxID=2048283 RepID=UPI001C06D604|nr:hypothetical protein [Thalassospira marina]
MKRRDEKSVNKRGEKPVYQPFGKGVEAAGLSREITDDMKLSHRRKTRKKGAKGKNRGRRKTDQESWLSRGPILRVLLTLILFGGALHGLFRAFGIYERNQSLSNGDQFVLLIKLLVFVTLMHLFYLMLMHYRPIRSKVRGLFFMALAPVAAVCIFMIYGGAGMFGSFIPILQFLTLTIGVGGFILYVVAYTWFSGKSVRRRESPPFDDGNDPNAGASQTNYREGRGGRAGDAGNAGNAGGAGTGRTGSTRANMQNRHNGLGVGPVTGNRPGRAAGGGKTLATVRR